MSVEIYHIPPKIIQEIRFYLILPLKITDRISNMYPILMIEHNIGNQFPNRV